MTRPNRFADALAAIAFGSSAYQLFGSLVFGIDLLFGGSHGTPVAVLARTVYVMPLVAAVSVMVRARGATAVVAVAFVALVLLRLVWRDDPAVQRMHVELHIVEFGLLLLAVCWPEAARRANHA